MCDTLVALSDSTVGKVTLFGKNSDRQRGEAQALEFFAAADHPPDARVACTYISIPQVTRTNAVLIGRPWWIWGGEMGANEQGVVIGNEGLQARCPAPEAPALLGMDLLRLALERASTACEAVEVLTALLQQHGQGGNCGHLAPSYYHNGYLIADAREAFVLETIDREWLVERVRGARSISNRYSIDRGVLRTSGGLPALVRDAGWSTEARPNYAAAITNPNREHIGNAGARQARSSELLSARGGRLTAADVMNILRDHGHTGLQWHPDCAVTRTLCMHAGSMEKPGQTVGSMVAELRADSAVHWVTGTSAPCISVFKPMLLDVPLPLLDRRPTDRFDPETLWWSHERLHRDALRGDFAAFLEAIRPERDALEADFRRRIDEIINGGSAADRGRVVADCWREALAAEARWHSHLTARASTLDAPSLAEWERLSDLAGLR